MRYLGPYSTLNNFLDTAQINKLYKAYLQIYFIFNIQFYAKAFKKSQPASILRNVSNFGLNVSEFFMQQNLCCNEPGRVTLALIITGIIGFVTADLKRVLDCFCFHQLFSFLHHG